MHTADFFRECKVAQVVILHLLFWDMLEKTVPPSHGETGSEPQEDLLRGELGLQESILTTAYQTLLL